MVTSRFCRRSISHLPPFDIPGRPFTFPSPPFHCPLLKTFAPFGGFLSWNSPFSVPKTKPGWKKYCADSRSLSPPLSTGFPFRKIQDLESCQGLISYHVVSNLAVTSIFLPFFFPFVPPLGGLLLFFPPPWPFSSPRLTLFPVVPSRSEG